MTRDEIVAALDKLLDDAWQRGWDDGYGEGVVIGQAEGRALQMNYIRSQM